MWSDYREVERRRLDRGKLDVFDRIRAIEDDLRTAKEASTDAKATGNKQKLEQTTTLIHTLRVELEELERDNKMPVGKCFERELERERSLKTQPPLSDSDSSFFAADFFDIDEADPPVSPPAQSTTAPHLVSISCVAVV